MLGCIILVAGMAYWFTSASVPYPGTSAKSICEALGATPSFDVADLVWTATVKVLWHITGEHLIAALNALGVILAVLSLFIIGVLIEDFVRRKAEFHFDPPQARTAGLVAMLAAVAVLALNPSLWAAANRMDSAIVSLFLVCLVLLLFRRCMQTDLSLVRVAVLWFILGLAAVEVPFVVLIGPILFVYFVVRCAAEDRAFGLIFLAAIAGSVGFGISLLVKAHVFLLSDSASLVGVDTFLSAGWYAVRALIRSIFAFFPRMGWLLQVSFYWVPLFAVLASLKKDTVFNFQERGQVILHGVLSVVLFAMVVISIYPQAYMIARPGVMIFAGVLHAGILGYLCAYWMLSASHLASKESCPTWIARSRILWGVIPTVILLGLLAFASEDLLFYVDARQAAVVDDYVDKVAEDLNGRERILTDGVVDHLLLLKMVFQDRKVELSNVSLENRPLYRSYIINRCKDPELKADAAVGLLSLFRTYISNPNTCGMVATTVLAPEAAADTEGVIMLPWRTVFVATNASQVKAEAVYQANHDFSRSDLSERMKMLAGSPDALAGLASWLTQQSSLLANETGVLLGRMGQYELSYRSFQDSVYLYPSNVSAVLNMETLIREKKEELSVADEQEINSRFEAVTNAAAAGQLAVQSLSATYGSLLCSQLSVELEWFARALAMGRTGLPKEGCVLPGCVYHKGMGAGVKAKKGDEDVVRDVYEAALTGRSDFNVIYDQALTRIDKKEARISVEMLKTVVDGDVRGFKDRVASAKELNILDVRMLSALGLASLSQRNLSSEILESILSMLSREKQADALVSFMKGRMAAEAGRWDDAERYIKYASSKAPSQMVFMSGLLEAHMMTGRKEDAERVARAILEREPDNAMANVAMGSCYLDKEIYEIAEEFYDRALRVSGDSVLLLNNLAWLLCKSGNITKAESMVQAALKLEPDKPEILDTYAQVLQAKGNLAGAAESFARAMELSGGKPSIALNYAELVAGQGNLAKASIILANMDKTSSTLSEEEEKQLKELKKKLR